MTETTKTPKMPANLKAPAPKVPGVPGPKPKVLTQPKPILPPGEPAELQKAPPFLWIIGIGVLILCVAGLFWVMRGGKRQASSLASIGGGAGTAAKPSLIEDSANPPVAPGVIATTTELTQPWAAKKFLFKTGKGKSFAAMLVRLPDNSYWAFALREPFGTCELEYVTDLDRLQTEYNFSATHPMVGDPCSHTVFDLSQYGAGPNGEVRGEIVAGTGVRPPLAIEVEVNGTNIVATRAEVDLLH